MDSRASKRRPRAPWASRLALAACLGACADKAEDAGAVAAGPSLSTGASTPTPADLSSSGDMKPEAGVELDTSPAPPDLPPPKVIDPNGDELGEFAPGSSVAKVLREAGLGPRVRQQVLDALSAHTDPARVKPGQRYIISREHDEVTAFALVLSKTKRVQARVNYDDTQHARWSSEVHELATQKTLVSYSGEIRGSLWASVQRAGAKPSLAAVFIDAFAYDLDFHVDTRAGDSFAMVVEQESLDGQFVRYGRVQAAMYRGHAGTFELYWWPNPKRRKRDPDAGAYFDERGRGVRRSFLKSPLKFSRVSSGFNRKRMHPVLHREKGHMGTDYAAPEGAPIWAAAKGKIIFRGNKGGSGNMVILRHANGLKTLYMHLSRFEEGQKVGTRVDQKEVIGYVGMTGLATGPHLHFGVQQSGRYIDAETVEVHREEDMPKEQVRAFKKYAAELKAQMEADVAAHADPEPEAGPQTNPDDG